MTKIKRVCTILFVVSLGIGFSSIAHAKSPYLSDFNTKYGTTGTALDTCTLCHSTTMPARNPYGAAFGNNGHNFTTIEPLDSDGDTFSNLTEINARKFPGDSNSKPTVSTDAIPPTAILSAGSFSAPRKVSINFTATDDVGGSGVSGYMVKLSSTPPSKSALNWKAAPAVAFTFPTTVTTGPQTLYAWAKDKAGNVSAPVSVAVDLDASKPTVTAFAAQATSPASGTVNITTLTATDPAVNGVASGVTAYMVTKSNLTAPLASSVKWINGAPPASVTFPAAVRAGVTLYAWVKDARGNVCKGKSAKVIAAPVAAAPVAQQAQPLAAPVVYGNAAVSKTSQATMPETSADMTIWTGKWFKITTKNEGFYTGKSGLSTDRQSIAGYLQIGNWDPDNKVFDGDLYQYDAQLDRWTSEPLQLNYISGDDLNFEVWSQVTGDLTYGFTARIQGSETSGALTEGTFRTLGGYHVQRDNRQGSTKHFAGWLVISGKMVPESEVQVPADALQQ